MHDVQLVTHCWSVRSPLYARFLREQLESLRTFPPKWCSVVVTVCFNPHDTQTLLTLDTERHLGFPPSVDVRPFPMEAYRLHRRAYGRDEVARNPQARILWFTDCDYCFGHGCLDSVADQLGRDSQLHFPRQVLRQSNREIWDNQIGDVSANTQVEFVIGLETKAIGGIQIIGSKIAEQVGYLPAETEPKYDWCAVLAGTQAWGYFRDDANWRRYTVLPEGMLNPAGGTNLGIGTPLDIPNVMRLRHGKA